MSQVVGNNTQNAVFLFNRAGIISVSAGFDKSLVVSNLGEALVGSVNESRAGASATTSSVDTMTSAGGVLEGTGSCIGSVDQGASTGYKLALNFSVGRPVRVFYDVTTEKSGSGFVKSAFFISGLNTPPVIDDSGGTGSALWEPNQAHFISVDGRAVCEFGITEAKNFRIRVAIRFQLE